MIGKTETKRTAIVAGSVVVFVALLFLMALPAPEPRSPVAELMGFRDEVEPLSPEGTTRTATIRLRGIPDFRTGNGRFLPIRVQAIVNRRTEVVGRNGDSPSMLNTKFAISDGDQKIPMRWGVDLPAPGIESDEVVLEVSYPSHVEPFSLLLSWYPLHPRQRNWSFGFEDRYEC